MHCWKLVWWLTEFNILTCLFRVSQLGAGKTQSLRRGERGSRDGEVDDLLHVVVLVCNDLGKKLHCKLTGWWKSRAWTWREQGLPLHPWHSHHDHHRQEEGEEEK